MKKRIAALLIIIMSISYLAGRVTCRVYADDNRNFNKPEEVLQQLTEYENSHDWEAFAKLCTQEYGQEILDVEDGIGIKGTKSAELKFLDEVDKDMIPTYALSKTENECRYFITGIEYSVDNVTKFFYNGTNYRLSSLINENGQWKLFSRSDIPKELLLQYCENMNLTYNNSENSDFDIALNIINARNSGYILDGNLEIKDIIADMDDSLINTANTFRAGGFRPGISAYTICMDARPSTVIVKGYGSIGIYPYVLVVVRCEWIVSASPNDALAAAVVMIEQYATWNVLYYQKYPDMGYDVKADSDDQNYDPDKYNNEQQIYKDMISTAWATSSHMHMETQDNYFFEAQYIDATANKTVELANKGYNYKEILHYIYDNQKASYENISIGTIRIREYQYFYPNPNY